MATEKKYKHTPISVLIRFLKRLIWRRWRKKIPENELTTILIEQILVRIKIDSRRRKLDPKTSPDLAYIASRAPWYDVDAFPWTSPDTITLLGPGAFGEAISLTEWEWWCCRPTRGGPAIVPIDKGQDIHVEAWRENMRWHTAKARSANNKSERAKDHKKIATEVQALLRKGLTYMDIATRFNDEGKRPQFASGIGFEWTERKVAGYDPDTSDPDHRRRIEAERKRIQRQLSKALEQAVLKNTRIAMTRRTIVMMRLEGCGYGTIAKRLNELKIPSKEGGKWVRSIVKRELESVPGVYSKCPTMTVAHTSKGLSARNNGKGTKAAIKPKTLRLVAGSDNVARETLGFQVRDRADASS